MNELASTRATLVVANIPDVIEAAYFIPVPELAEGFGLSSTEVEELGLASGDYVTLEALPAIEGILTTPGASHRSPRSAFPLLKRSALSLLMRRPRCVKLRLV